VILPTVVNTVSNNKVSVENLKFVDPSKYVLDFRHAESEMSISKDILKNAFIVLYLRE